MRRFKRLRYFLHQFLTDKDFNDEQAYHIGMRRLHNRRLHTPGVVEGLDVVTRGDRNVVVEPGLAIDTEGREVVLESSQPLDTAYSDSREIWITITYKEVKEEEDRYLAAGVEDFKRITESAEVFVRDRLPGQDSGELVLAKLTITSGKVTDVDSSVRRIAGAVAGKQSISGDALRDGSVTRAKMAPGVFLVTGWQRHTFKPHGERQDRAAEGGRQPKKPFVIGPTEALCGGDGASGSMGLAVPAGAVRATDLTIAGRENAEGLTVRLYRCGWNSADDVHVKDLILEKSLSAAPKAFEQTWQLEDGHLDPRFHSLAVWVEAKSTASVSLIAVRYEFEFGHS